MATMLILNSKGPMVAALQQGLNKQGYKLTVDGFFGPKTQAAVLAYNMTLGFRAKPYADDATLSTLGVTPAAFKTPTWQTVGGTGYGSGSAASGARTWAEIWEGAPSKIRTAAPPIGAEEAGQTPYTGASLLSGVPVLAIGALALAGVAWWMWNR